MDQSPTIRNFLAAVAAVVLVFIFTGFALAAGPGNGSGSQTFCQRHGCGLPASEEGTCPNTPTAPNGCPDYSAELAIILDACKAAAATPPTIAPPLVQPSAPVAFVYRKCTINKETGKLVYKKNGKPRCSRGHIFVPEVR